MSAVISIIDVRSVGQGAFIRGQANVCSHSSASVHAPIRWVYDCGSDARAEIIDASVHDLAASWPAKSRLDILVVSHFDRDHISGLPTLLSRYTFKKVLMPHLPRLMRILAVLAQAEAGRSGRDAELLAFADDPVAYIRDHGGGETEIIFVDAADGADFQGNDEDLLDEQYVDPTQPLPDELLGRQTRGARPAAGRVSRIASGHSLRLQSFWELIPYVDNRASNILLEFDDSQDKKLDAALADVLKAAEEVRLIDGSSDLSDADVPAVKRARKQLGQRVGKLKSELYAAIEANTGKRPGPKEKNAISLMAYISPIVTSAKLLSSTRVVSGAGVEGTNSPQNYAGHVVPGSGWLLTGDADLSAIQSVDSLVSHVSKKRIENVAVFQVPHHGSKHNSAPYTAQSVNAPLNFFNANPHGKNAHPDPLIVSHFNSPVLVNARAFRAVSLASDDDQYLRGLYLRLIPWRWDDVLHYFDF
jgi:Metallo-beta-lactamase superfamily.